MAVRLVLQAQYRKPIDFTDEAVFSANNGWNPQGRFTFGYQYGSRLGWEKEQRSRGSEEAPSDPISLSYSQKLWSAFKRWMMI